MAAKTIVKILNDYFNQGDGKRTITQFAAEMKALSDDEKVKLAQGVCDITGDTILQK